MIILDWVCFGIATALLGFCLLVAVAEASDE